MGTMALLALSNGAQAQWNSDSTEYDSFDRYRIGGYGEMVAAFKDYGINRFNGSSAGNSNIKRNTISIPRFVLAGDVKFNKHWRLGAEIEFESGGTGTAYEIENTENGEYEREIEKGGEVALEQFHLTYHLNNHFNIRIGHMIVPVGLTNSRHEPINYFGTVRPEGESTLMPCTWHETGIAIHGQMGRKWASFQYEAMVIEGLNANGFDRNTWVAGGKQGVFEEDNLTSPAYAARLNYTGVPGLRLGASVYYCANTAANADKPNTYNFRVPVTIWSLDAQFRNRWLTTRANILRGHLDNALLLSNKNTKLSNASPYSRIMPIANQIASYGAEAGVHLRGLVHNTRMPDLIPFVRYEYFNAQERVEAPLVADKRLKTSMWTTGINYKPLPYLVIKADYTTRRIGDGEYKSENELALGIAFVNWFHLSRKKG